MSACNAIIVAKFWCALQAVHSGADLQSAAATVMGYKQAAMKGKAILVDPVPIAASEKLKQVLQDCLLVQAQQVCLSLTTQ